MLHLEKAVRGRNHGDGSKETGKGQSSKKVDGRPYRGVSQTGPDRYRAQICNRGKVGLASAI